MSYLPESSTSNSSSSSTKSKPSPLTTAPKGSDSKLSFNIKPITATTIRNYKTQCLIIPIYDEKSLPTLARALDNHIDGLIKRLIKSGDFQGKAEQVAILNCPPIESINRIILFGCGKKTEFNSHLLKKCIAKAAEALAKTKTSHVTIAMSDIDLKDAYRFVSQTIITSFYKFSHYISEDENSKPSPLKRVTLLGSGTAKQKEADRKALNEGIAIGRGSNYTRTLGNLPSNVCTPTYLAKEAQSLAKKNSKLQCKVYSESDLKKLNANAFLSVSQGSDEPAKMIVLDYKGSTKKSDAPHVFVGKGITFDTGGICLKPPGKMDEMKYDMCGAATVLGLMKAVTELKLPINVIGVVAAAENMPSGRATRPGDIVTTMSGQTVEILNTDAEGRLVLCDTLTFVERYKPASVIDIATLTGACIVALGHHTSGLMGNNDDLNKQLLKAGELALDKAWQLPMSKEYSEQLESNFADFANIGSGGAGTITAACFLAKFTKEYRWAHLDIAGTAWVSGGKKKGATGRPVPLLAQYLLNRVNSSK